MKRAFAAAISAAALLSGACGQPVSPVNPSSVQPGNGAAATVSVPFRGSFEGTQTVTPLPGGVASVTGSGTGTATHLGQFSVAFPHTVTFATRTGEGTYTFTAANGDTLTASFVGQATEEGSTVSIVEHGRITGGTGRFADASGTFTVQRAFNQANGVTEGSFDGAITW
jgi:hypothetical protein